jgi:hypothetical protein
MYATMSSTSARFIAKCGMWRCSDRRNALSEEPVVDGDLATAVKSGANRPVPAVSGSTEWHSVHQFVA